MPWYILWRILAPINIAAHHSIQISPANDKPKRDTPFIYALDVVARPGNSIRDAWVNTHGGEEGTRVRDAGGSIGEEHSIADDTKEGNGDIAETALVEA